MIQLKIVWDGEVPGLRDHRISVGLFGKPLTNLLASVRRTANNILRSAHDRRETDLGRLTAEADRIDIQILSVVEGSGGFESLVEVEVPVDQLVFWPEGLAEDAVERVLDDIEKESRGIQRNASARNYLTSLPFGLTRQDYYLTVDGVVRKEIHLGALDLAVEIDSLPYLAEITGRVIGVGFEPGKRFVRVKSSDATGSEFTLTATDEQVDRSLERREAEVRVLVLMQGQNKKLLRLQAAADPRVKLNTDRYIFEKWRDLLARLAQ